MTRTFGIALALMLASTAQAGEDPNTLPEVKPLQGLIGNFRQERDLKAVKFFASEEQGKYLTGEYWSKATPEQQQQFTQNFQELFAKIAFPKLRKNFEHMAGVVYTAPRVEKGKTIVDAVVEIDHPLKKQELKLQCWVTQEKGQWKVVDISVSNDSILQDIRDAHIMPRLKAGGWDKLFQAMKDKMAEKEMAAIKLK